MLLSNLNSCGFPALIVGHTTQLHIIHKFQRFSYLLHLAVVVVAVVVDTTEVSPTAITTMRLVGLCLVVVLAVTFLPAATRAENAIGWSQEHVTALLEQDVSLAWCLHDTIGSFSHGGFITNNRA